VEFFQIPRGKKDRVDNTSEAKAAGKLFQPADAMAGNRPSRKKKNLIFEKMHF